MTKVIMTCFMICFFIGIISFGLGYEKSKTDNNNVIKYSYCVETETSVKIVDVYFKNYGKDKEKDDISYHFSNDEQCLFLGLSTFINREPVFISHTDWGCEHKQEMIKRCKKANENR